jgi:histone-lysine N-methyltransferase SETMAR
MLLDDRRIKLHEIAETLGISKERVGYILHKELDMKKLCARRVPLLLTVDQIPTRMKSSEQCLERFNRNKTHVRRFITMDGTWIHHYTAEFKQQSNSRHKPVVQRQKGRGRFHQQERSWHRCFVMLEAFFIDYLEKDKIITGKYYSNLLTRLDEKICE